MNCAIPFNRPHLVGRELEYIARAVEDGHISGDGAYTKKCQSFLQETLGVKMALLTTSCTHTLEMAALLLDLQPGDEVIVPSFTFVSTINAFVLHGARPIFADIRPDTLNLNESLLARLVTPRTRAIIPVHYAGVSCEMDAIQGIAERYGISLVEDNAHGLFGKYKGKYLGTFGRLSTQSFHETKNFSCGEGGALLISDPSLCERAEIIREKGTNRNRFFRGQVDKYTWVDVGSSYLPSDILAAFLLAQLEARDSIQAKRRWIWDYYCRNLSDWADQHGAKLPSVPTHCDQTYHMFYLLLPTLSARQELIAHLRDSGIHAVFHYLPLHISRMGRRLGGAPGDCPVAESVSDRLVRLPFFYTLDEPDLERIVEAVRSARL